MVGGQGSFFWNDPLSYWRLVGQALGHENWAHFLGNFSFLLLLGPVLEEKYQTPSIVLMSIITALVTGILNVLFFKTALMGASGIVFLMILLTSFTNIRAGEIPLTLPLILIFFLGKEVMDAFKNDNISHFAHIAGGIIGSLFGFLGTRLQTPQKISSST
jgi:membrane associated rhomboid family serine protease